MGQVLDDLYRLQHHHNRMEHLENKILEYEQFMEQWLVTIVVVILLQKKLNK